MDTCNTGLHVTEVAHDIQVQVSKYVKHLDSYDTWHGMYQCVCGYVCTNYMYIVVYTYTYNNCYGTGTKNVAKEMKKITEGWVKERGKNWFPELADKSNDNMCNFMFCPHASNTTL